MYYTIMNVLLLFICSLTRNAEGKIYLVNSGNGGKYFIETGSGYNRRMWTDDRGMNYRKEYDNMEKGIQTSIRLKNSKAGSLLTKFYIYILF